MDSDSLVVDDFYWRVKLPWSPHLAKYNMFTQVWGCKHVCKIGTGRGGKGWGQSTSKRPPTQLFIARFATAAITVFTACSFFLP